MKEIADKGEALRSLYLILKIGDEISNVVVDGIDVKKSLSPLFRKAEKLIPLIERELPNWARDRARQTYDTRSGFVCWEEEKRI